jgi:hypothetical protein
MPGPYIGVRHIPPSRYAPERRGRRSLRFPVTESVKNRSFRFGFLGKSLKMSKKESLGQKIIA